MSLLTRFQLYRHAARLRRAGLKLATLAQVRHRCCLCIELPASLGSARITAINGPEQPLRIGAHSYVRSGSLNMVGRIGRFCSIGQNVALGEDPRAHPTDWASTSPALIQGYVSPFQEPEHYANIGHDVWVGHGAVVMAGVTVATGAIIGGNAMVTRDVPPYHIAAGNPARVVGMRFPEEAAADLLASHWWELPYVALCTLQRRDPIAFAAAARSLLAAASPAEYPTATLYQRRVVSISGV
ncbi:MAG: Chloramphenicol acetyltransferase [Candidatus Accumulibacter regalis]|uniref:Chloramphenicol acetyltransferase n=1 Tax=Accumulibacter regalis TaxID=522306 RepID=A0A011P7I0_ACCRE|nr:CatB-related O-acetyltransferase [Accumulibacter sp.]EXI90928.1 MAG: Chloramphenicol acetyltransferase [Candidatus Accumulibacter regalis]HRE69527.1 CatB-related O-acetyltransferase [Accumulibacter sp.]HRE85298.1 CatB-related O-acetyltransferase [Accumulibacter sp.]